MKQRKYFMIALEYERDGFDLIDSNAIEATLEKLFDEISGLGIVTHWEHPQVQEFSEQEVIALTND